MSLPADHHSDHRPDHRPDHPCDPAGWSGLIAFLFLALCLWRLGIPSQPLFDEVHYLPAARALGNLAQYTNQEHPLLGKEFIAAGIALFGDNPKGWRIFSALAGAIALFAFMRCLWFASASRFAALAGGLLLASNFLLFVQSRIAMLDIFMACFLLIALWMCAGAMRHAQTARWRLAIAGVALGCAMASKWNAVPLAMLPGLGFLVMRALTAGSDLLTARRGWPAAGITLPEAALWLGLVPLITYTLTFIPAFMVDVDAITPMGLFAQHAHMLDLQGQVVKLHPYQSVWYQWMLDNRAIWYLYEEVDGAQRGVLLVGNPLTMWLGLAGMLWCGWAALFRRNWAALGIVICYAISLGMWPISGKPIQFYYHYFVPSCFLAAGLALALDDLWKQEKRAVPLAVLVGSCAVFVWFYPILSSARLDGTYAFERWMWLDGWR